MKQEQMKATELFDITHSIAGKWLEGFAYPWEALAGLSEFIKEQGEKLPENEFRKVGDSIWIHRTVKLPPTACLGGPAIIGKNAQIRTGAFVRGSAIIGEGAVLGNSCEIKNAILFDKAQVPHFSYVGDSILGFYAHMGAGAVTSNVKSDKTLVCIHAEDGVIETGMKKFGAMLGDHVEIGCNSVLNPGTIIGRDSNVYPLSSVRGCVDSGCIYKNCDEIVKKR